MDVLRQKKALENANWTREELEIIDKGVSNSGSGECILNKLCQLIPSKSKEQDQAKLATVRTQRQADIEFPC